MASQHATFLASKTVADVLSEKKNNNALIDIHVTATVEKVFETLESNGKCPPVHRVDQFDSFVPLSLHRSGPPFFLGYFLLFFSRMSPSCYPTGMATVKELS
jgi:hypothetical protein